MKVKLIDDLFLAIHKYVECKKIYQRIFIMNGMQWHVKEGLIIKADKTYLLDFCSRTVFLAVLDSNVDITIIHTYDLDKISDSMMIYFIGNIIANM